MSELIKLDEYVQQKETEKVEREFTQIFIIAVVIAVSIIAIPISLCLFFNK
jgi:signal transduction histidine kinase